VRNGQCSCMDYRRHSAEHPCKHLLALALGQELGIVPPQSTTVAGHQGPLEPFHRARAGTNGG
jgi:hypothetical protein